MSVRFWKERGEENCSVDITPIVARLNIIADCVNALKELQPLTYEEFARDYVVHAAVERHLQVAIQAALDIGSMILAELSAKPPKDYASIFPDMSKVGILPPDFADKLAGMARFRNVLVHLYVEVDLRKVLYHYLQTSLGDFELFIQYVSEYLSTMTRAG